MQIFQHHHYRLDRGACLDQPQQNPIGLVPFLARSGSLDRIAIAKGQPQQACQWRYCLFQRERELFQVPLQSPDLYGSRLLRADSRQLQEQLDDRMERAALKLRQAAQLVNETGAVIDPILQGLDQTRFAYPCLAAYEYHTHFTLLRPVPQAQQLLDFAFRPCKGVKGCGDAASLEKAPVGPTTRYTSTGRGRPRMRCVPSGSQWKYP